MVITGRSSAESLVSWTTGACTSRPNSMTCAVSMKMISSTRTTSTRGTTFISDMVPIETPPRRRRPFEPFEPAVEIAILIRCLLLEASFRQVEKFQREILHARADLLNYVPEVIVEDSGGDCTRQSHGGGHQGARDAGADGAHAGGAGKTELIEGVDDSQHGPKQADEGAYRGAGRQPTHV